MITFGVVGGLLRLDIGIAKPISDFITFLLLITIGLKGGIELADHRYAYYKRIFILPFCNISANKLTTTFFPYFNNPRMKLF